MIISKTPLRMSFAGGGSDFKGYYQKNYGSVVSTAIDKYIYVTVNKKFDDSIRISYSKTEETDNVEKIEHNLVREAMKLTGVTKGIDISYMSDMLPAREGTGLGASSSLTVGILNALYAYKGQQASAEKLAKEACQIEIEILGDPIGKQDQYAAAFGGFNYIKFNSDGSVLVEPIKCGEKTKEELNKNLLLFYTGMNSISSEVLPEQKKKININLDNLDEMVKLAEELKKSLNNNDLQKFGEILHQGWILKQKLASKITNSAINDYYQKAREAGAVGGKILGSGGGGFLLFYCNPENQNKVRQALSNLKETFFKFETEGSKIVYTD
ncbi:MAG: GHMP kinase [Candidatus Staskawiczbacteria bacterium]|jgi:D-glycero-alpha-D-manno-heptose-7-phosphate kinase